MPKTKKAKSDEPKKVEKAEKAPEKVVIKSATDRIGKLLARDVFKALSKDHGSTILAMASDARMLKSNRIPTGIFPLDKKLGGGVPQGRVTTVYGMKSTGKTYIVLKTIAQAQRMCSLCWSYVEWLHAVEKDMEVVDEKTGEVTKVLDDEGEPKKKKIWEPVYVRRWWSDDGKWKVMLRGDLVENPDEDARSSQPMVPKVDLGEEIRPKCNCGKYRETVCAYIDVEGALDKLWAVRLGVELMKMMISQPADAETSLDIMDALARSGDVDVLALDSLAFLAPQKEIAESTAKNLVGEQPRIVGKGTRKVFVSALNASGLFYERRPTILLTNQIRMKVGVMFGNPETQPAGLGPGFASSVEIKTKGGHFEFEKVEKGSKEEEEGDRMPLEVELPFDIEKNKIDVPKRSGHYRLILVDGETKKKGDVYDEDVVLDTAEEYGLIKKEGTKWSVFSESYGAKSNIERRLLTDPLFSQRLRAATLATIMATDKAWNVALEAEPVPEVETEAPEA